MTRFGWAGALVLVFTLAACEKEGGGYVTWSTGLHLQGTAKKQEVAVQYHQKMGEDPVESIGTTAAGDLVGAPSGTLTVTVEGQDELDWLVVGQTKIENPLVPGHPEFGDVPVAVLHHTKVTTGKQLTVKETFEVKTSYRTETETNLDRVTAASFVGWAGDEYLVEFGDLSLLWDPDLSELWETAGRKGIAGLTERCKANVSVGDFWVSPNGQTLYRAIAKEPVDIGGRTVTAVKVQLTEVGTANAPKIAEQCLVDYDDQNKGFTTGGNILPGHDYDEPANVMHLDPGCSGAFTHHKVGFEWWYGNVLVKEEATYYIVKIEDFGYEWIDGAAKTWNKAQARPKNVADPTPFVQYTLTTKTVKYQNTLWQQTKVP